jgi:hypothetical protein
MASWDERRRQRQDEYDAALELVDMHRLARPGEDAHNVAHEIVRHWDDQRRDQRYEMIGTLIAVAVILATIVAVFWQA